MKWNETVLETCIRKVILNASIPCIKDLVLAQSVFALSAVTPQP